MNRPLNVTHYRPLDEIEDLVPRDDNNNESSSNTDECDCPFPWWWVVLAGVAGGGIGYAAGKRKNDTDELEQLEP